MKNKSCSFTGHRQIPSHLIPKIKKILESELTRLINQGVTDFYAGGALGFDTLAAQTVLTLRAKYPQIRLFLVLPHPEQTRGWNTEDMTTYYEILTAANGVEYTADHYFHGCMQKRNRRLIEKSGICVCFFNINTGGTAYMVKYAQNLKVNIINIAE